MRLEQVLDLIIGREWYFIIGLLIYRGKCRGSKKYCIPILLLLVNFTALVATKNVLHEVLTFTSSVIFCLTLLKILFVKI